MSRHTPKSRRRRFRYILFRALSGHTDREVRYQVMRHLSAEVSPHVRLIGLRGGLGIVRVDRSEVRRAREALNTMIARDISLRTLTTSGTLRAISRRRPEASTVRRRMSGHVRRRSDRA